MSTSTTQQQIQANQRFAPSNLLTVIAIAIIAYAADDTVHELIGHGTIALFLKIKILAIATVGLQTAESNRLVAAAGAVANVVAGVIGLLLVRRSHGSASWRYFLWLFGFLNLMNGTGYLMASALLNSGDWAVVIAGLQPPLLWRGGMGLIGLCLFAASIRWATTTMIAMIREGSVNPRDIARLTVPAYFAGGFLFVVASVFNPYGRAFILPSGAGASFGITFGLLLIPGMVKNAAYRHQEAEQEPASLAFSKSWIFAGALVGAIFIGIFGRGILLP